MFKRKISIVTVNLNNASGLEATIKSVLLQKYDEIEFVIVDGDSSDESKNIISKYSHNIQQFVCGKDKGIYDAMNKGLTIATGDYVLFLNSGDTFFCDDVLEKLLEGGENSDIIYGNLMVLAGNSLTERLYPEKLTFRYFLSDSLPHPASLVKKALFHTVGFFFDDLKIVADWAFFILAIAKYNYSYKHVPIIVANFDFHGISSQVKNLKIIETERTKILKKYFSLFLDDYVEFEVTRQKFKAAKRRLSYRVYKKVRSIMLRKD